VADKRIRMDDLAAKKKKNKKKKPSSDEAEWELPIFEDRVAYANLLGGCVGPLLPPPDTLLESRKFAETVSHFFQVRAFFFLLGVNDQFIYLSQVRANAQLIKAFEHGGALATEKDQVEEWLKDFTDAEANLNRFITDLKENLKAPAPEPTPLTHAGHRSVEALADEMGVADQSGSLVPAEGVHRSEELD